MRCSDLEKAGQTKMKTGPDFRMIKCYFPEIKIFNNSASSMSPDRNKHISVYVSPENSVCFSHLLMTDTEMHEQLSIGKSQAGSVVYFDFIY